MTPRPGSVRGFTLVELLVVVAITVVLSALSFAVFVHTKGRMREVGCAENLRQIGYATMLYAGDHRMTLPMTSHQRRQGGISWTLTLQPYSSGPIVFKCPDDENHGRPYTYVINDFLTPHPSGAPDIDYSRLSRLRHPASTVMFAEAAASYINADHFHFSPYRGQSMPAAAFEGQVATSRHRCGANYLFADGHLEALDPAEVRRRLANSKRPFLDPTLE